MLVPGESFAVESPPWQSVQARRTVPVGCMEGSSLLVWHETQPEFLPSTSACDWPSRLRCFESDWARERPSKTSEAANALSATTRASATRRRRCDRVVQRSAAAFIFRPHNHNSKLKPHVREYGIHDSASVDVFQPLTGNQSSGARRDGDIFREGRPVSHTDTRIKPDTMANRRLE